MKFKDLMLVLPVAFLLVACGRSNGDSDEITQASTQSPLGGSPSAPAPTPPSGGGTTTPPPSTGDGTQTGGCPANPSRKFYSFNFNGTGKQELTSPQSGTEMIRADSKLRIGLTPLAAGATSGTGGKMEYDKMAARVSLMKNGSEVAFVDLELRDSTNKFPEGIQVGQMSNLAWGDFSSFLEGSGDYYIKVSRIRTNKGCRDFCKPSTYMCGWNYQNYYGDWYCNRGTMNYDYNAKSMVCCYDGNMLDQCNSQQCGVNFPLDNAAWSLNVRVETDSTTCIQ